MYAVIGDIRLLAYSSKRILFRNICINYTQRVVVAKFSSLALIKAHPFRIESSSGRGTSLFTGSISENIAFSRISVLTMSSYSQHIFRDGGEKEETLKEVAKLDWARTKDKDAITKSFKFKNFVQAFSFMTAIALEAEKIDHHPEWSNVYNNVEITLTSHFCNGVSLLDIKLARIIDNIYSSAAKE